MRAFILVAVAAVALCGMVSGQACNAAAGVAGPVCMAGETCCGEGTMTPSCIAAGSTKQCCRHFLSSTQCNASQSCCGSLGTGASSFAYCCDAGSTCCKSSGTGNQGSSCCPAGSQCCAASNLGFCCRSDQVCNLLTLSCDAKSGSTAAPPTMAPATNAPAPVPSSSFQCSVCSADQVASFCGRCSASDRFVCTSGAGAGGCGGADTWGQQPQACSACCACPASGGSGSSSSPNEVTTAAPVPVPTSPPASGGDCGFVFVDAQLVLSGASWPNVQANGNAWNSLGGALVSDLASLLGRAQADIGIRSLNAAANALTVVFTVRSNALAEAARIAALIRDDVPASAPLPAANGVYASVAGSSADVSVASHTATSRDAFDSTCAAGSSGGSAPNEVTTAAPPVYSSQPAEVTTQAPAYSSQPAEVTTSSPSSYSVPNVPAGWGGYSPATAQASWMPWLAATAAVAVVAVMVR